MMIIPNLWKKKTKNIALQSDMFQTTNQPRSSVHSQSQHVHPDVSEMPLADGLAREPPKGYVQWEKTSLVGGFNGESMVNLWLMMIDDGESIYLVGG